MSNWKKKEKNLLKKLNTPEKVQDFLNDLSFNFEKNGETARSPKRVIRYQEAHCLEGAILGAYILSLHGYSPLILHLEATKNDFDHCIAPFKRKGLWGALSKTNHAVLRYREPIYKTLRELVMSYFHEYFLKNGVKTLRRYSRPLNLSSFKGYEESEKDLWEIDICLDKIKHYDLLPKHMYKNMRKADKVEIKAGEIVEYRD